MIPGGVGNLYRGRYGGDMSLALIGHGSIRSRLLQVAASPAAAYGFFGPEHIGKRGVANEFARAVLGMSEDMPLTAHPDLVVFDARGESGVEEVKQFLAQAHQTAAYGGRRVFMIDHADELNAAGTNALLKDVEEPRSGIVFLLIASRPEALPATLRSRMVPLWHGLLQEQEMQAVASKCGAPQSWVSAMLGRPGLLMRRQADPAWWERCVSHAAAVDSAMRRGDSGLVIAAVDDWQKSIEKTGEPQQEWRILLLLLMERWRFAPDARLGEGLVASWRYLETAIPARFGIELMTSERQIFQKRGIL